METAQEKLARLEAKYEFEKVYAEDRFSAKRTWQYTWAMTEVQEQRKVVEQAAIKAAKG